MDTYQQDDKQKVSVGDMMKVKLLDVRTDHRSNILSAIAHIGETAQYTVAVSDDEEVVLEDTFDDDGGGDLASDEDKVSEKSSVEADGTDDDDSIVVDGDDPESSDSESYA